MEFKSNAPAGEVDAALRETLEQVRRVEGLAVLWFAEVVRRRLYRALGFGSMHQYAAERLGFSRPRIAQYMRLTESLEVMGRLRESLASGRTTWTKVRTVLGVASPSTEAVWLERVETMSRRDLEAHVARVRAAAKRRRVRRDQARLALGQTGSNPKGLARAPGASDGSGTRDTSGVPGATAVSGSGIGATLFDDPEIDREAAEVPVSVSFRLSPVQAARYEALLEKARKLGLRAEGGDLLLAAFEELVESERARRVEARAAWVRSGSGDGRKLAGTPHEGPRLPSGARVPASVPGGDAPSCSSVESQRNPQAIETEEVGGSLRRVPRGTGSPYEIHVAVCPECERGRVETNRGSRTIGLPQLRAAACDARVRGEDGGNRSSIPPRVRRRVLDRDGHRCRAAACRGTRFLEVHHRIPRSRGGNNHPDNLITLCSACHRATHVHEPGDAPLRN